LSEEPFKSITKYFKDWGVDDYLVINERQIEKLVPKEYLSTGFQLFHRVQELKLKPGETRAFWRRLCHVYPVTRDNVSTMVCCRHSVTWGACLCACNARLRVR
jgi:hypothetical protein